MIQQQFCQKLKKQLTAGTLLEREPMSKHTSFRIGGPADLFVQPANEEELWNALHLARQEKVPFFIVGNGSNLLVSDEGFRGMILHTGGMLKDISVEGDVIYAQAGALLSTVAKTALEHGLAGMEFAAGIPGTLGGAVCMNAGAYGGEMKDILLDAEVLTQEGERLVLPVEELDLSYRHSVIFEKNYVVLAAHIRLSRGDTAEIKNRMNELAGARRDKQPLEYPSAGSTFKRPEGYFAGKLIQDAGLKGYTVGGAQVSEKHSGFVINRGGATAEEVRFLIRQVQQKVRSQFGVELEPEVRMLGFDR
ncbi:MAG TPA: UDP-N-acetylmuramate dehydrogenase [Candidatus Anaerobutyricum stercoripullorum]|uniref:UDP-N-acetylenolpyruvoylglucosamine reductase n=1 Tax=Candidatus Anaerobutyricum stercoripullorum TaxID=2838456 RepID=A0A9D2BDY8_9FIRM|nr:UDP-N-acetylmuramate dehydrogenase [Candidatus Anaerobutyricum stercoripullorum]